MTTADQIQAELENYTLPALAHALPADEFVMPHYGGLGIANLPTTIAALLGAELPGACPPLRRDLLAGWGNDIQRIILVVFDALGYHQLCSAMQADDRLVFHRLAQIGSMAPIASVFPSTTCTVLTTLWTGYAPAAHGSLAFEVFLRELGTAASLLFFWPIGHRQRDSLAAWGIEPAKFIPVRGLAERLSAQGIDTHSVMDKAYANSLFTQALQRGVQETTGFVSISDMWLSVQRALEKHRGKKLFLSVYGGTIDGITHQHSPVDPSWQLELRLLSQAMEEGFLSCLTDAQRKGTLLLITADHGGVTTLPQDAIQLKHHPDLHNALTMPPLGESRVPFLYTRSDTLEWSRSYMQERLGRSFVTLTRQQVLDGGLLGSGPLYAETPHRLGDLIAVARGGHYLARDDQQLKMMGRHGGLSAQEMLVPLIGVRLDAL